MRWLSLDTLCEADQRGGGRRKPRGKHTGSATAGHDGSRDPLPASPASTGDLAPQSQQPATQDDEQRRRRRFVDGELQKIYFDLNNPTAFASREDVKRAAQMHGITPAETFEWLSSQEVYTRYKPARKKFPLNFYNIKGLYDVYEIDLNDMRKLAEYNDGYNYILTMVCCLSRYVWAFPLKTKTAKEVAGVLDRHFTSARPVRLIQSDKGKEFVNRQLAAVFNKYGIQFRTLENRGKAAMVEIVNRSLKTPLWKYFEHTNSWRWLEALPQIVFNYNHRIHRTTGMRPADVTQKDVFKIWSKIYLSHTAPQLLSGWETAPATVPTSARHSRRRRGAAAKPLRTHTPPSFTPGEFVRISLTKELTEKGFTAKFSRPVYIIKDIVNFSPFPMYTLTDVQHEPLRGRFYGHELQRVTPPAADTTYRIERILDRRRRKGVGLEYLVRWQDYSSDFDSWVSAKDLQDL
ncbi:uncharacterized protein LOC113216150 isoform X1 [Frankliniella occidentalis]|uniref:Uncharacterized protein LOC113216150 isoform X1 n=1 Tax=Frankliniella occidentalis TaxID=133901 RepID=A0A6J1TEI2_FRAOC|nr:uncharacterized protein LOC113216150 isoform X1 [Frankliniella occidentalis]